MCICRNRRYLGRKVFRSLNRILNWRFMSTFIQNWMNLPVPCIACLSQWNCLWYVYSCSSMKIVARILNRVYCSYQWNYTCQKTILFDEMGRRCERSRFDGWWYGSVLATGSKFMDIDRRGEATGNLVTNCTRRNNLNWSKKECLKEDIMGTMTVTEGIDEVCVENNWLWH